MAEEVQDLKDIIAQMAAAQKKQSDDISRLVAAMGQQQPNAPNVQPSDPAVVRADKLSKLSLALHKSQKVKDFKDTQEGNVRK